MNYTSFRGPSGRLSAYSHHGTSSSSKTRSGSTNLHLPGLPRYHPMNYASPRSSAEGSPTSSSDSPTAPMSPRQRQQQYGESQRQLYQHQRDLISYGHGREDGFKAPPAALSGGSKPSSPRLNPLGSPGPVTPLELERTEGYLLAGAGLRSTTLSEDRKEQIVEHLIQKETRASRRADPSASDTDSGSRPQSRAALSV